MKKLIYPLLGIIILLLTAQTNFDEWKKKQNEQFSNYISKQDKEFSEFLKKNWEEFEAYKENKLFTEPKIDKAPVFNEKKMKNISLKTKNKNTEKDDKKVKINLPEKPKITNEVDTYKPTEDKLAYSFWGFPVALQKSDIKLPDTAKIDKNYISKFWYKASVSNFKPLLEDLKKFREKINLNDWGYCLLIHSYSQKIFPDNGDNQNLFDWFLLIKSGYNVKVGFNSERVVLLMPSKETIYGYPYIKQNGKNFYLVDFNNKKSKRISVYTYNGSYPNADDILDFEMTKNPNLKKIIIKKELKFKYNDSLYTIPVEFDKNISEFLKHYPNTDLSVYFNSELGPVAKYSIVKAFTPILNGKSHTEAINILLRFMQTAFEYKTDQEQFGYEKVFFPEETLFYPYSDCEDRAILFSYLVRTLLNMEVIGLDYPGHVATAVNLKYKNGDLITFNGKNYLICDPTYINAPLGNAMPKFKHEKPKIIEITQKRG